MTTVAELKRAAKERGEKRFTASPCKSCGGTERYTSSGSCVDCTACKATARSKLSAEELAQVARNKAFVQLEKQQRKQAKKARKPTIAELKRAAKARGDKTFVAPPCKRCGNTVRYTTNGSCVECVKARANAASKASKAERDAKAVRIAARKAKTDAVTLEAKAKAMLEHDGLDCTDLVGLLADISLRIMDRKEAT